ncbi:hypothetical protein HMPREF0083_00595 [Aneurinibacillus aneurinilyticus ATCC 12856]|uniref:Uncharacterized protein n=1 Tax=Aneurinibacillus aneurinilyticus ATCC 12856 TaxID=649747 RepID=U1X9V8_ANEAE|nr:hypothetical protein HMPREF0083_00595 [Aneurinibacillus aneurinilyticus ATCC 12856]
MFYRTDGTLQHALMKRRKWDGLLIRYRWLLEREVMRFYPSWLYDYLIQFLNN